MVELDLSGKIADSLLDSLSQGPIVNSKGQRLLDEARIAMFGGFKVEIFADEHPPPHFRITYQGETACYKITDGAKLIGGLDRYQRNILKWYRDNRGLLIEAWNTRRPSDCTVGIVTF